MGQSDSRSASGVESTFRSQPESVQGLHSQRDSGPAMDLPLRRRDAELPATVDRSASVATSGALPETGKDAAEASGRHPELLSHEGSPRSGRSREWEHQVATTSRAGIPEPALPAA